MRLKNYILTSIALAVGLTASTQSGLQKKADNLFNKFSFVNAAYVYKELVSKNDNADYATRQLADCYAYMRNPDSAVVYYKKVVEQPNVPSQYFYNYAEGLRGTKDYQESRIWLKRFKDAGGNINDSKFLKDADFINTIFNSKPQYTIKEVTFNSKYSDFGAFEKDGNVYFASSRDEGVLTKHNYGWNNEPFLDIYVKSENDTIVNTKSKINGDVNTVYHEGPLTITKDGKTLYFSRNDFNKHVLGKNDDGTTNLKIYKATLVDGKWKNIVEVPFNSNSYSVSHPALNNDETKLYFASDMPGGLGGTDIYFVNINNDGTYGSPQNLGNTVNTDKNESFPFINSENVFFFASDGHQGLGLLDIFGTVSDDKNIVSVINLGQPVNSSKDDFSFFMSIDGLSGYFASNRDGGVGSDDIYAFNRTPQLKIEGVVTDAETNTPIANATVTLLDSNSNPIATLQTDNNGHYEINIDRDADYYVHVKNDDYLDSTIPATSKGVERSVTSIKTNISISPNKKEIMPISELQPIYFDYNKHNIRQESTVELDRIVSLMMNTYPNMVIRIESHTDSRGTSKYNAILSEERAKATYNYLIKKGVDASRITNYKGYGEQKLTNSCDDTVKCTEAQHQLNRRTQFIVIRMQ